MFKSISPPFSDRFRWLENKASTYLCLEKGLYFYPSDKLFRGVENFSVSLPIAEPSTHPKMRIRAVRFIFRWVRKSKIDPSKCLSSGCLGIDNNQSLLKIKLSTIVPWYSGFLHYNDTIIKTHEQTTLLDVLLCLFNFHCSFILF